MSICSRHRIPQKDCAACQATPHDLFPDWDEAVARAEAAGKHTCTGCGFVYYKTTESCPKCYTKIE